MGTRSRRYLTNGIPPSVLESAPPAAPAADHEAVNADMAADDADDAAPSAVPTGNLIPPGLQAAAQDAAGGGRADDPLFMLRFHPQFNQLKMLIQQNPAVLQQVLQQLGASNPELLQLITQNQERFVEMMNEPIQEQPQIDPAMLAQMMQAAGGSGGAAGEGGDGAVPPGARAIQVTQEEKEAIERLQQLGFDRGLVLEAYLACDKNEQLAANYLFEHANEE